jgi:hypothetical protein
MLRRSAQNFRGLQTGLPYNRDFKSEREQDMTGTGRYALSVNELEEGEYHYVVLEAVTMPGELLCFRPRELGERAHERPMDAWFSGLGAVRRMQVG